MNEKGIPEIICNYISTRGMYRPGIRQIKRISINTVMPLEDAWNISMSKVINERVLEMMKENRSLYRVLLRRRDVLIAGEMG